MKVLTYLFCCLLLIIAVKGDCSQNQNYFSCLSAPNCSWKSDCIPIQQQSQSPQPDLQCESQTPENCSHPCILKDQHLSDSLLSMNPSQVQNTISSQTQSLRQTPFNTLNNGVCQNKVNCQNLGRVLCGQNSKYCDQNRQLQQQQEMSTTGDMCVNQNNYQCASKSNQECELNTNYCSSEDVCVQKDNNSMLKNMIDDPIGDRKQHPFSEDSDFTKQENQHDNCSQYTAQQCIDHVDECYLPGVFNQNGSNFSQQKCLPLSSRVRELIICSNLDLKNCRHSEFCEVKRICKDLCPQFEMEECKNTQYCNYNQDQNSVQALFQPNNSSNCQNKDFKCNSFMNQSDCQNNDYCQWVGQGLQQIQSMCVSPPSNVSSDSNQNSQMKEDSNCSLMDITQCLQSQTKCMMITNGICSGMSFVYLILPQLAYLYILTLIV